MKKLWLWLLNPPVSGPGENIILRITSGGVFIWEGIIKFLYPSMGVLRFAKLGFPFPGATSNFIGSLEIVGGTFLVLGLLTRGFGLIFMVEMLVATLSTKITMFLGTSPLPLPAVPPQVGLWGVLHDFRSEFSQFMCCLYLVISGPGPRSLDAKFIREDALDLQERKKGGKAA
jgi:putative oxidoreductase